MARLPWLLCLGIACRPADGLVLDPPSGSSSGYYPVTADLTATDAVAADVSEVWIGGVRAYDVQADGADQLQLMVQGAPAAGAQTVELHLSDGDVLSFDEAFSYDGPVDSVFERLVSMGSR